MQLRAIARLSGKRWCTPNRPDRMRRRQDWRCTCIQKLMAAELRIHTKAPLPALMACLESAQPVTFSIGRSLRTLKPQSRQVSTPADDDGPTIRLTLACAHTATW